MNQKNNHKSLSQSSLDAHSFISGKGINLLAELMIAGDTPSIVMTPPLCNRLYMLIHLL